MAKITVIIPLFNKAAYIKRALDSVLAQTFGDFELIVVDDGSTDGGGEIVARCGDRRVRLIRQPNAGPAHARNRGIDEAASELVAFLDADDEWMPRYLEHNITALEAAGPEVACASCGYVLYPGGRSMQPMWRDRGLRDGTYRVSEPMPPQLLVHLLAYLTPPTTVARLASVRRWGGFCRHGKCVYGEDSFLWLKLLLNEPVAVSLTPLVKIHAECSSLSGNLSGKGRPIEPILTHAGEIEGVCPPQLRDLLKQFLSLRAMKTACVMGYWGRWREGMTLLDRFCPWSARPTVKLAVARACATPVGAAAGWMCRASGRARAILPPRRASQPRQRKETVIAHLTASPFFGGPERQMIGLASTLPKDYRSVFLSFPERGLAEPFIAQGAQSGFEAIALKRNFPNLRQCVQEVTDHLRRVGADVLVCHIYKPNLVGWLAARRVGIPFICVSRGWTWATLRVRLYEAMDRGILRAADHVVCVSEAQAAKVRWANVSTDRINVIHNSIRLERFASRYPDARAALEALFPVRKRFIIGAAGRLSPEKGFSDLIAAAAAVVKQTPDAGFVIFGDGPLRQQLQDRIAAAKLSDSFVLAPFRDDLDRLMPSFDVVALSSLTEGLPNVVLEASAAGVPVVATAVGGTGEIIQDGVSGYLVPPAQPTTMADRLLKLANDPELRSEMGRAARERVRRHFSFETQSRAYQRLIDDLLAEYRRSPLDPMRSAARAVPQMLHSAVAEFRSLSLSPPAGDRRHAMNPIAITFWVLALIVLYTYFVYPLLIATIARFWPRPPRRGDGHRQAVSFVLTAKDEADQITRRIGELFDLIVLTGVEGEVIVVSDGSEDKTADRARAHGHPSLTVIELPENKGKAFAQNAGCEVAHHPILVFADARQSWAPDALVRLLENFADPRIGAVSGDLILETSPGVMAGVGLYWRYEKWLRKNEGRVHSTVGVTGAICAVRRELRGEIPAGAILDDVYWPMRVVMQGFRVVHDERAKAFDRLPTKARDEFKRKVRTMAGNFQLARWLEGALIPWRNPIMFQFISHKLMRLLVPWALLGMLVTSAMLRTPLYNMLFAAQVAFYLFGLASLTTHWASKLPLSSPVASFLVLNSAAWMGLWVWVSGGAVNSWHKVRYDA